MLKGVLVAGILCLAPISFCEEPSDKTVTIALAGSSACESFGNNNPDFICGWGEVIGKYFDSDVEIQNFAVSGFSTKLFIEKGQWEKLLASKPDYIFMTLGVNDARPDEERHTDPETTYRDNLLRFARDAKAIGAEIIFVTLNQTLTFDKNGKVERPDRKLYNKTMRTVAAKLGKPCLELSKAHSRALEKIGYAEGRKLYRRIPSQNMKLDPAHTNKAGAEMVAKLIADELKKSDSNLKNHMK